jgi:hypothetical protein
MACLDVRASEPKRALFLRSVRARLGNELYMTLYADAIKQAPVPANLTEVYE